ncbi:MAG: hypothetical protein KGZ25_14910, partial [Planctomycetes bacterium]|nr:hypothetical protein [Planctomycetota bacterium]
WQAHTDATIAELRRFRFMLGQYHDVLLNKWETMGEKLPRGKRVLIVGSKRSRDFVGPQVAHRQFEKAKSAITLLIENHENTPWEVVGKRLQRALHPWRCVIDNIPSQPRRATPARPDMDIEF